MQRFILIIFLISLFLCPGMAQMIEIDNDGLSYNSTILGDVDYPVYGHISNLTDQDLKYVWVKENTDCEDQWEVSMCIGDLCYQSSVDTKEEDLEAFEEGEYSMHLNTFLNPIEGSCESCAKFYAIGGQDTLHSCAVWTLGTTSNEESFKTQISFYPNPVVNGLNITSEIPLEVEISNALGQAIYNRSINAGVNKIDLQKLYRGIYTIQFVYQDETILTKQLIKR